MMHIELKKQAFSNPFLVVSLVLATAIIATFAPVTLFIVVGALLFVYFWNHKDQLIIFLICYTPFEEVALKLFPESSYAVGRYMWEGMLFVFLAIMISNKLILTRSWRKSIIDKLLIVFLVAWVISTVVNHISPSMSLMQIKNLIRYVAIFYLIYNLKPDLHFVRKILNAVIIIGVIQSVICIGQAIEGDWLVNMFQPRDVIIGDQAIRSDNISYGTYYMRFIGTFPRSNELAYYLVFVASLLVAKILIFGKKLNYYIPLAFTLTALLLTSSRISWISLFVAIGVMLFKVKHHLRLAYAAIPIIIIIAVITGLQTFNPASVSDDFNVFDRFLFMFTPEYIEVISTVGRLYAIVEVLPAVLQANPLFGIGPGSFMYISQQMSVEDVFGRAESLGLEMEPLRYVHDVGYVALLVQAGLIGLLAILFIFVRVYRVASNMLDNNSNPIIRLLALSSIALIAATAIQHLACFNLAYRNQSLIIWTMLGLTMLFAKFKPQNDRGRDTISGNANVITDES